MNSSPISKWVQGSVPRDLRQSHEPGLRGNAFSYIEGQRAILQGKFTHYLINERIEDYVDKYVICHECNRPDTRIIREGRIFLLKCAACGATAPLKSL